MSSNTSIAVPVGIITVLVLGMAGCGAAKASHREETTITVDSKERVSNGKTGKYLVFTDKGTFEVTDSLWAGRWDSSDVYGQIDEGATYHVTTQGWRIPFFSEYPNLIELDEVAP